MSKICPNCGKENPDDVIFCQYCGTPLESTKGSSSSQQPNQTQSTQNPTLDPSIYQPNSNMTLYSDLQKLRHAFYEIFFGTILVGTLTLIVYFEYFFIKDIIIKFIMEPIIECIIGFIWIGALIILAGYISLISGFGLVSKTNLPHAKEYKFTRNWLLVLLILSILDIVAPYAFIISTYLLSPNPLSNLNIYAFIVFIVILLISFLVIYLITYLKLVSSLKYLSSDLSVQSLYNAGNYLFYGLIINIIFYILMLIFIYINISIFLASWPFFIFILGILAIPIVVVTIIFYILMPIFIYINISIFLASWPFFIFTLGILANSIVVAIIAFYDAYTGIDKFLNRYRFSPSQHT